MGAWCLCSRRHLPPVGRQPSQRLKGWGWGGGGHDFARNMHKPPFQLFPHCCCESTGLMAFLFSDPIQRLAYLHNKQGEDCVVLRGHPRSIALSAVIMYGEVCQ
ncbi:unnamed protein product [Ectocarpus fasciculatus]